MSGRAWVLGDDVDTDALAPGRHMHGPIETLAAHCLEDLRPDFAAEAGPGDVILARRNFGMGSSREQAAEALRARGIAGVVALSFAGIFFRNAVNLGLPALVGDAAAVADGAAVTLEVEAARLRHPGGVIALTPIPKTPLAILRDGGLVPHLARRLRQEGAGGR